MTQIHRLRHTVSIKLIIIGPSCQTSLSVNPYAMSSVGHLVNMEFTTPSTLYNDWFVRYHVTRGGSIDLKMKVVKRAFYYSKEVRNSSNRYY